MQHFLIWGDIMIFDTHFSETDSLTYGIVNGKATVIRYEGDEARVVIPSSLDGYPVTKIEPYAFSEKSMKYIQFPETLEIIDHHGFSECRNIRQLDFPERLKSIGNYAFYNCWGLEEVHLTSNIRSIGYGAFKNCEKLKEIIQDKVEGHDISIGSLLDDLNQQIHVVMRHLYPDKPMEEARVIFTEHDYEVVANVASMCKQFEATEIGSGKYIRYCIGIHDIDYNKYDGMFHVLLRGDTFDTIITVAMERLMYPYSLTMEARDTYHAYIQSHCREAAEKFIQDDDMAKLKFLADMGVMDSETVDQGIDLALALDKTEYTAFLMDYKHQHFSMAEMSFDL